jgi:hypothetical protein
MAAELFGVVSVSVLYCLIVTMKIEGQQLKQLNKQHQTNCLIKNKLLKCATQPLPNSTTKAGNPRSLKLLWASKSKKKGE